MPVQPSIAAELVREIFQRLAGVYGTKFTGQWTREMLPEVTAVWAKELREFVASPKAIEHGFNNLPSNHVPNALEFRDICRAYTRKATTAPERAPQTREEREQALSVLAGFQRPGSALGARDWARRLQAREEAGEPLSKYQRESWRIALGFSVGMLSTYEDRRD